MHEVEHRCHARWHQIGQRPYEQHWVRVGEILASSRWYVELVGGAGGPARLYPDDTEAYAAARRVMEHYGPDWEPVPCYPTEAARLEARRRAREETQSATGAQAYSGDDGSNSDVRSQR